ncbi:DNA polymerase III subunit delta [Texcoconibacillus texcoconensis]|uniref:DNA polymerase III subunit delta n=1 Tax=Texcoconibacillus texcoconensis TaxID=1095777 RepID=A0A840QRL9_9BACI|nr:DNA polymerase III subunit delta [Texcoconibacillus texcoconensis]MBB5173961.1 DNA polymerase-3 subunit delta [Texcoconibacillus texcoconensis]
MSYFQLRKQAEQGDVAPFYLLWGTETFLIEDLVQTIVNSTLSEEQKAFNLTELDMKESPIDVAVEDAYTFPFMGGKRVVIAKDAAFLTNVSDKSSVEHNLKKLEQYIQDPLAEAVLILIAPYEKLDQRKKIVKLAKQNGTVMEAKPLTEQELRDWLVQRAREEKVNIDKEAAMLLIERTSGHLMLLATEMTKLVTFTGENGTIDRNLVDQLVARTLEQNIFDLVDGVVNRNVEKALRIFYDLLKQKEEPIKIVSLIARQFRIMYQVKQLVSEGYAEKQIASQLKLHPYAVKVANRQVKRFSFQEIRYILARLADADYEMKSGKVDKQVAVEMFFANLTSRSS